MADWHKPEPHQPPDEPDSNTLVVGCGLLLLLAAGIVYGLLHALGVI